MILRIFKMATNYESLVQKSTVRIKDRNGVLEKLKSLISCGPEQLQIICDFDYTLTKYSDGTGERCWSTHALFTQEARRLKHSLGDQLVALYKHYNPIEFDPKLTTEEKVPFMLEWWSQAHEHISKAKFSRQTVESFIENPRIYLRDGATDLLKLSEKQNLPFILFSAGIGDLIEIYLQRHYGSLPQNLHIISNRMKFDENGYGASNLHYVFDALEFKELIVGFEPPTIHTFNKNSSVIDEERNFSYHLSGRHNVLLLGDSLGDIHMDVGVKNEGNVLKIGFLNVDVENLLPLYSQVYDIVLIDDQTMDVPLDIVKNICENGSKTN